MLYWKLRDLIGYAIFASRDADFLEKIILTTPSVTCACKKKLQLRQHALEIPEDNTIQNIGIHGSITGKTMMRIICFDHITSATTPLPNRYRMKRTSYNGALPKYT